MLNKWFKKSTDDTEVFEDSTTESIEVSKSLFKKADIVFVVGVLAIIGLVIYMVRSAYVPTQVTKAEQNSKVLTPTKVAMPLSTPPPYKNYESNSKPWIKKEKSNTIKKSVTKTINLKVPKRKDSITKKDIFPTFESRKSYKCTVLKKFKYLINREILYYRAIIAKDTTAYIPAFNQQAWNEKGVIVKYQYIVHALDKEHSMVEVQSGKWIPALAFSECVEMRNN